MQVFFKGKLNSGLLSTDHKGQVVMLLTLAQASVVSQVVDVFFRSVHNWHLFLDSIVVRLDSCALAFLQKFVRALLLSCKNLFL